MRAIGTVRTRSGSSPSSTSEIVLDPKYEEALLGIEEYSHVVIVFWMNRVSKEARARRRVVPPYAPKGIGERGVLATRIPGRPNPIGVSTVALVERRGNILVVRDFDGFSGTPILDVKPFTGHPREHIREFTTPKWEERGNREQKEPMRFLDIFRTRGGRVVIGQKPNIPILVWFGAFILGFVFRDGGLGMAIDIIGFLAIFIWAGLELFTGVNTYRRMLGFVVIVVVTVNVLR